MNRLWARHLGLRLKPRWWEVWHYRPAETKTEKVIQAVAVYAAVIFAIVAYDTAIKLVAALLDIAIQYPIGGW
jgi:hypothetical protein